MLYTIYSHLYFQAAWKGICSVASFSNINMHRCSALWHWACTGLVLSNLKLKHYHLLGNVVLGKLDFWNGTKKLLSDLQPLDVFFPFLWRHTSVGLGYTVLPQNKVSLGVVCPNLLLGIIPRSIWVSIPCLLWIICLIDVTCKNLSSSLDLPSSLKFDAITIPATITPPPLSTYISGSPYLTIPLSLLLSCIIADLNLKLGAQPKPFSTDTSHLCQPSTVANMA